MIRRTPGPPSISASTSALLQSHSHSWLCSVNLIATASETPRLIRRTPRPPPISASTSALLQSHSHSWLCGVERHGDSVAQPFLAVLRESHRDGIGNTPVDPPDSEATAYFGQHLGTSSIAQPGMAVLPKGQTA